MSLSLTLAAPRLVSIREESHAHVKERTDMQLLTTQDTMWAPASLILSEDALEKVIQQIREIHYADHSTKTWTKLSQMWTPLSTSQRMGAVTALTVVQDVTRPGLCRTLTTLESQKVEDTMKHVETDQSYSTISSVPDVRHGFGFSSRVVSVFQDY